MASLASASTASATTGASARAAPDPYDLEVLDGAPDDEGDGGGDAWTVLGAGEVDPRDFSYTSGSEIFIVRTHWEHTSARTACASAECAKPFSSKLVRRDWCRRCGRIFCVACVSHRRKLSPLAVPDPERGKPHRVCLACFLDGAEQVPGATVSRTAEFALSRAKGAAHRAQRIERKHSGVRDACVRLVRSFSSASPLARSVTKLAGITPDWTKVNFMPEEQAARIERCKKCAAKFTLLRLRYHCRLCGDVYCADCLFSSLQVYAEGSSAKVDILTPENTHKGATILQACGPCLDGLEDALTHHLQRLTSMSSSISSATSELTPVECSEAFLALLDLYPEIFGTHKRAKEALVVYQKLIDAVGTGTESSLSGRGTVTTLAKHQIDLSDMFTRVSTHISDLKKIQARCTREVETHVTRQVTRLCCGFYTDHLFLFRSLKRDLSEILPEKALMMIQKTMNGQVLNYTYMVLQQLAIESMAFPPLEAMTLSIIAVVRWGG